MCFHQGQPKYINEDNYYSYAYHSKTSLYVIFRICNNYIIVFIISHYIEKLP